MGQGGDLLGVGSAARTVIDLIDGGAAPLHLPLGSDTYQHVRAGLVARLAEHDAHRETALSVVRDDLKGSA